jgi:ubiquitin-protein ligase
MALHAPRAKTNAGSVNDRLPIILLSQYQALQADPHPNLLAQMETDDMRVWHFMVRGLDAPYAGGEYIFRLTAPDDFPQKPPIFEFFTPNGLYMPGGPICISVGEFHADDKPGNLGSYGWRAALGMRGFATQVVNGMICYDALGDGIRITNAPAQMKSMLAKCSHEHNARHHARLAAVFDDQIAAMAMAAAAERGAEGARDPDPNTKLLRAADECPAHLTSADTPLIGGAALYPSATPIGDATKLEQPPTKLGLCPEQSTLHAASARSSKLVDSAASNRLLAAPAPAPPQLSGENNVHQPFVEAETAIQSFEKVQGGEPIQDSATLAADDVQDGIALTVNAADATDTGLATMGQQGAIDEAMEALINSLAD